MNNFNKIKNSLSLVYFSLLGLVIFLPFSPFLVSLALLSILFPKCMDLYYWLMLKGIHFYIAMSPLRFAHKELPTLSKISQRKCIIICNHRSHLDMFLFLSEVYKVRAVANSYLLLVPLLGQVIWMSGHFMVKVGNIKAYKKALEKIKIAFERQDKVLFFPETHRCTPGFSGINRFHLTAFQIARENNVEIIPVVLKGTDKIWPKGELSMDFSQNISIKELPVVNPNSFHDTASLVSYVHNQMLNELERLPT